MRRLIVSAVAALISTPVADASPQRVLATVSVSVVGNGTVTSAPAGIACPSACTARFSDRTTVALTAHPGRGARFVGWSGACSGSGTQCSLSAASDRRVVATFAPARVDADRDGYPIPEDCNDADAAIHPRAREIPGNSVDENCDGVSGRLPVLSVSVRATWVVSGSLTRVKELALTRVPTGALVSLRCRSGSSTACPFQRRSVSAQTAGRVGLLAFFGPEPSKRRLPAGTVIEVRVTAPGTIGKAFVIVVRSGKMPTTQTLCITPGAKRPVRC